MRPVCPLTVSTSSAEWNAVTPDGSGKYTSTLASPHDQTEGTYNLVIGYSAYVVASSNAVTAQKTLSLTVRTCNDDGTKYTTGNFEEIKFSEYDNSGKT